MEYTDDVRGIIIGGDAVLYEFWTEGNDPRRITWGTFRNDGDAIAWFREQYPTEFARGAEMRVFDHMEARHAT